VKSAVIDPTAHSCTIFSLGQHTVASPPRFFLTQKINQKYQLGCRRHGSLFCMCVMLLIIADIAFSKIGALTRRAQLIKNKCGERRRPHQTNAPIVGLLYK
jgi:hypothetical protein